MSDERTDSKAAYTSKQMGDACEMLIAAELTLAGVPALKASDYWPGYDVIAQPKDAPPQRISVKSRNFQRRSPLFRYSADDVFDWLAIVILHPEGSTDSRQCFVIPRRVADDKFNKYRSNTKNKNRFQCRVHKIAQIFAEYENNFCLSKTGRSK